MPDYKCPECNDTGTCPTTPGIRTRWACTACDAHEKKAIANARTQALDEAKAAVYAAANSVPDQDCTARAWDTAMLIVRVATESIEQLKEKQNE